MATVKLNTDLPRGDVMTVKGFAKLLTLAVDDTSNGREMMRELAGALEDICPELDTDGLTNSVRWAEGLAEELQNISRSQWQR